MARKPPPPIKPAAKPPTGEKQKPTPSIVNVAAKALRHPTTATAEDVRRMAARILDDQKNDPIQHKPTKP